MNQILERLNRAIEQGHIPREVPYLRAERALLLARMGDLVRCRAELQSLRTVRAAHRRPDLDAWLSLVESLSEYFENLSEGAYTRALLAVKLARAGKAPRIQALATAWCAHLAFRRQRDEACIAHLGEALRGAAADHLDVRARAAVVTAGIYQFAGDKELARPWYAAARHYASQCGDGVTLSSLTFNMAAIQVMEVRLSDLFRRPDADAKRQALMALEASSNLDAGVRMQALQAHTVMQQALVLVAHERYADALHLHDHAMVRALVEGLSGSESLFHADRAWCQLQLGRSDEARLSARAAESALVWATEAEERAVTHGMLARVFAPLGLPGCAQSHADAAQTEWATHQRRCRTLLGGLEAAQLEVLEPLVFTTRTRSVDVACPADVVGLSP